MTQLLLLAIVGSSVICCIYGVVAREDFKREATADDAMWMRSIEEFRRRAAARPKPDTIRCAGHVRRPLATRTEGRPRVTA